MARNKTGLEKALSEIPALREEFWKDVRVLGDGPMNQSLEKAGRVADFFELGELMVPRRPRPRGVLRRPLPRGAPDRGRRGAARRRELRHVAAWEWTGEGSTPEPPQGTAHVRGRPPDPALLQVRTPLTDAREAPGLAPGRPRRRRSDRDLRGRRHHRGDDLPRDARHRERAAHRRGQGADRLRARLPRGHLRHLRDDDQRPGPRPRRRAPPPASSTCGSSPTATRSTSSRGGPRRSRC